MNILAINITPEIYQEAENRNLSYKNKYGNSGTHRLNKDRQRMTGYLAEASIKSYFPQLNYSDNDNVDFIIDSITIDSKAQGCNTKPLDNYVGTLYEEQKTRDVDYYIFSRVKNDFSVAWICGAISKKDFESALILSAQLKWEYSDSFSSTETNQMIIAWDEKREKLIEIIKNN